MIVTCPNCQTRYNLPDDKVPASGAKVKCSKCAHVFKAEHPPASPEEEVESLLEDDTSSADTQAGDDFEETFDDVATDGADKEPEEEKPAEEPDTDGDAKEDMPSMDDLFDDTDETPTSEDEDDTTADESLFSSDDDDLFAETGNDDTDEDGESLFDEDEEDEDEEDDLFQDDDADEDEEEDDEDEDDDLELDDEPRTGSRRSLGCLIIILIIAATIGAGVYFKAWTYLGVDLGNMLKNVPFVGQMFMEETGGNTEAPPGESPADRVRKIELKNVKQYYVANEKVGNLFVVEGKAVNKFAKPKEQIKVEVVLYDATGNVLASQAMLCGNVLSQFQLQVQSEKEIKDGLSSQVGILSNNTFIRPGASTPFMAVFFQPPTGVKEFLVKVVDIADPE